MNPDTSTLAAASPSRSAAPVVDDTFMLDELDELDILKSARHVIPMRWAA
jgi:hypothetical protein